MLLGGVNIAFAEESGGFVGIGIGGGGTQLHSKGYDTQYDWNWNDKTNFSGVSYGFVAGYKQFFNDYLGLRYYANLDIQHTNKNDMVLSGNVVLPKINILLINYGANVDFLGNFVVTDIADFGGFIGFGIGANTLTNNKGIIDNSITNFDVWLNLGLRTNIAKYHGLEVVAKVPFLPVKMWEYTIDTEKDKTTFGQKYSILARYTFSF